MAVTLCGQSPAYGGDWPDRRIGADHPPGIADLKARSALREHDRRCRRQRLDRGPGPTA